MSALYCQPPQASNSHVPEKCSGYECGVENTSYLCGMKEQGRIRVYLLSTYEEYGSTGVIGTTNPEKLHDMLDTFSFCSPSEHENLDKVLGSGKCSGDGFDLSPGWGGVQLHVIDIQQ